MSKSVLLAQQLPLARENYDTESWSLGRVLKFTKFINCVSEIVMNISSLENIEKSQVILAWEIHNYITCVLLYFYYIVWIYLGYIFLMCAADLYSGLDCQKAEC